MELNELGRKTVFHLKRAEIAYKNYLKCNRKYIHAKNIKKANDAIYALIVVYNHIFPKALEHDILKLLEHIEIWTAYWEELKQVLNPALNDEFIFQYTHPFPKDACQHIINYFEHID